MEGCDEMSDIYYAALFDNPETFRREYWKNFNCTYSVCAFVILGKRVPEEFSDDWRAPFIPGQIYGPIDHLPDQLRVLVK